MNKAKSLAKLKKLTWEDLDWIQTQCASLKESAPGARVYRSGHPEAPASLSSFFADTLLKHHGCSEWDAMEDGLDEP